MTEETALTKAPAAAATAAKRVLPAAERQKQQQAQDAAGKQDASDQEGGQTLGEMPRPGKAGGISQDDPRRPGFVRQPFGAVSLKLSAPKRAGYHRHWFNDELDRIAQAKAAGYTHVLEESTNKPMKRVVGTAKQGGALTAYLMEIPKEWFEADMAVGQKMVDEVDAAIRGGTVASKEGDERYVPNQGKAIRIEQD